MLLGRAIAAVFRMRRLFLLLLPLAALAAFTPPLSRVSFSQKTQIDLLPLQHLLSPITLNVVCIGCAGDGNQIFVTESAVRVWLQRALARTHVVRFKTNAHCFFLTRSSLTAKDGAATLPRSMTTRFVFITCHLLFSGQSNQ